MKRTLLDDVLQVYFTIPCNTTHICSSCKNDNICKTMFNLLKSLRKHY